MLFRSGLVVKQGRGCLVVVNKWDVKEGERGARERFNKELQRKFRFLPWAPVLFGSALKPNLADALFPLIDRVMKTFSDRIPTGSLNKFLQDVIAQHPLPVRKGRPTKAVKSVYATQVATKPPVITLFVGRPQDVGRTYLRFLENRLREQYDFSGAPLRILVRQK